MTIADDFASNSRHRVILKDTGLPPEDAALVVKRLANLEQSGRIDALNLAINMAGKEGEEGAPLTEYVGTAFDAVHHSSEDAFPKDALQALERLEWINTKQVQYNNTKEHRLKPDIAKVVRHTLQHQEGKEHMTCVKPELLREAERKLSGAGTQRG